jgi:molybdopterin synthase sulfur carrier subunit
MSLRVLYFAWVREKAGINAESVDPPPHVTNVAELIAWLRSRGGGPADALADVAALRVAVNQEHVHLDHPVASGDEIAFFPPMTGGSAR